MNDTGDTEPDYRFTLANERTFLAWIRTALALIAGGIAVVQFLPSFGIPGMRHGLGLALIIGGGLLSALSTRRWSAVQTAMRQDSVLPPTRLPALLSGAILIIAILMFVVLIMRTPVF